MRPAGARAHVVEAVGAAELECDVCDAGAGGAGTTATTPAATAVVGADNTGQHLAGAEYETGSLALLSSRARCQPTRPRRKSSEGGVDVDEFAAATTTDTLAGRCDRGGSYFRTEKKFWQHLHD